MQHAGPGRQRDQFTAQVISNTLLCREHYRLALSIDDFPLTEPGQFVQVLCRASADSVAIDRIIEWNDSTMPRLSGADGLIPAAVLRRPFSLAGRVDRADGAVEIHLIQRIVGVGTAWLSALESGDEVSVIGPLGNRFTLPPVGGTALLIGGGVGIPPMLYLAEKLAGRNAIAFAGALTRDLFPLTIDDAISPEANSGAEPAMNVAEFARHGVSSVLSTDDGSIGFRGFITQALERYLDEKKWPALSGRSQAGAAEPDTTGRERPILYTCGPEPMMKRVAAIAADRGLECQIAVERAMACGMGTCQSCCIRVKKPDPAAVPLPGRDWCWRLACTDGPVFKGSELLW